jgi:sec-independent protein translocase protein TatC
LQVFANRIQNIANTMENNKDSKSKSSNPEDEAVNFRGLEDERSPGCHESLEADAPSEDESFETDASFEEVYDYYDERDAPEFEPAAEAGMSFLEHLEDFRWTVARSAIAFVVGLVIVSIFIQDIAAFLKLPIIYAYGSVELVDQNLITYRPMGVISVFIQIALLSGFTLSMPFVLYFLANFVAPGLTEREQKVLRPSCLAAFILFLVGVAFAFFVVLPLTLGFSVRLNQYFGFELLWAASDYYSMVVWSSLFTGAFFEFPLIIVVLIYLKVLTVVQLKAIRKGVFVALMVFAALMSPGGDFISLPLTTGFMYGLYELAIWVGSYIERRKQHEA